MISYLLTFAAGAVLGAMFPTQTLWVFGKVKEWFEQVKAWFKKTPPTASK